MKFQALEHPFRGLLSGGALPCSSPPSGSPFTSSSFSTWATWSQSSSTVWRHALTPSRSQAQAPPCPGGSAGFPSFPSSATTSWGSSCSGWPGSVTSSTAWCFPWTLRPRGASPRRRDTWGSSTRCTWKLRWPWRRWRCLSSRWRRPEDWWTSASSWESSRTPEGPKFRKCRSVPL